MIDKEELRTLQQEIDVEKWLASEQAGRDLCGEATYCTYCDKTLTDPCARSSLIEQAEKAAEGREVDDSSEAKEEVKPSIDEKAVEATVEVARPGYEQVTRYRRSLKSKLIQNEAAQGYYNALKNEFLGYDGVRSRISFNYETFRKGKKLLAKFVISGKTLSVYLALSPEEFEESKYRYEDVSEKKSYAETPMRVKITSKRASKHCAELIGIVCEREESGKKEKFKEKDYRLSYRSDEKLIEEGLIKPYLVWVKKKK